MLTIGVVANLFQEANALPGWLESATSWADWVGVMHAGPGGEKSGDGTLEILEKWGIPTQFCAIDDGFGVVRTKTLRMCPCDYTVLLDADERLLSVHRRMTCGGESTPPDRTDSILTAYTSCSPNWDDVSSLGDKLSVNIDDTYNQAELLRYLLRTENPDAVCTVRRHWHNFTFRRPTQNWMIEPDWQMRIVRNDPSICFDPSTVMHERLVGAHKIHRGDLYSGPFIDHFHLFFKKMEMEQRRHDVEIYNAIHKGWTPPRSQNAKL